MSKTLILLISIPLFLITSFLIYQYILNRPQSELKTTSIHLAGQPYTIEIADSLLSRSKGLGGRNSLCANCGMLFVFNTPGIYPFWMKDTLIPLDMIWLDSEGKIVTIHTATPEPGAADYQLKKYSNNQPALYVLELNAHDADKLNLNLGDTIDLSKLHEKQ